MVSRRWRFSCRNVRIRSDFSNTASSSRSLIGFVRKSAAPSLNAWIAMSVSGINPEVADNTSRPWAIRSPKGVFLANSASTWSGYQSPLKAAKLTMSASVMVLPLVSILSQTEKSSKNLIGMLLPVIRL